MSGAKGRISSTKSCTSGWSVYVGDDPALERRTYPLSEIEGMQPELQNELLAPNAGFGGSGTIIGATANIIVVTLSEKTRHPDHFKNLEQARLAGDAGNLFHRERFIRYTIFNILVVSLNRK